MYCSKCGSECNQDAAFCTKCGQRIDCRVSKPAAGVQYDPALALLIPIGRSGLAIAAGYVGLFAVLLVPAPFAILLGVLALKDIKAHPEKSGNGRAIFGIVMGVLGTIGLIAMLASLWK